MKTRLILPFGTRPYPLELPARVRPTVVHPPDPVGGDEQSGPAEESAIVSVLQDALEHPVAAPRLSEAVLPGSRVVIIVTDATRDDPRDAMVRALLACMPPDIDLTIAVANGTHGPSQLDRLDLSPELWARASQVVNHDAHCGDDLVTIGTTRRGTPVKLHRCVVDADWVIATGRIKPHYFAGYGAGCKAIFPGLGANDEIRINHRLKSEPGARPGQIDGNPCRDDLEEAVAMLPSRLYLLNTIVDHQGRVHSTVAGHITEAFRAGARRCEPMYRVSAPRSSLVIVSDSLPLTGSLYQASKLVAATADLLLDGGTMIIVAECPEGTGPVDTVNRAIYEIGLAPRLPANHHLVLVSGLTRDEVEPTYCKWAPSVESAIESVLARMPGDLIYATVLPHAGSLIIDPG